MAELGIERPRSRGRLVWLVAALLVLVAIILALLQHGGNDGIENAGPTGTVNPGAAPAAMP